MPALCAPAVSAASAFRFTDRDGRPIALVSDVTERVSAAWRDAWSRQVMRVFYVARCFRDEPPADDRSREFTQVGVELLGGQAPDDRREVEALLVAALGAVGCAAPLASDDDGFRVRGDDGPIIAAGGRYPEGIGWAIGLERLDRLLVRLLARPLAGRS